ncbi:MAG: hypothetical protein Q8936_10675 [Bacillota bacterium]|nr:hypothetical protein [Bacillota bacterium]
MVDIKSNQFFKTRLPAILLVIIILFAVILFSKKSFNNLLGTSDQNITKVLMRSGSTGNYVETTDKAKIKELINLVNNRDYHISLNQASRSGYIYYYDFYSGDESIIRIMGCGSNVNINGIYYNVSKEISADSLNNWFNSLPVKQ